MQYSPEEVWDDMDTGVPYADLSKENKELWGEAVKSRMATPERADSIAARNKITKKETKRKKPVAEEPPDIGEREAAEFEQPKKSVGEKEEYKPTTGANIIRAIKDAFVSGAQFDRWVRVYDTQQEAIEAGVLPKDTEGRVQGFFHDGKVFLIAENIEQGQELGVFLHEFGVHFGLPRLIGKENVEKLGKQISEWALGSGRLENELARKALARIPEGTDPRDVNEELIAYFVEEAFAAGITPQGIKDNKYYNTGMMDVVQFVRRFLAALKIALRKIGFAKFDNLTAENIVDLAYGAADLELDGSYHGTAALFRRFNHEFMGSGEGAQAFGWGSYLAQRFGIGKDYFKKDIKRKTKYQERQFGLVDKNGNIVEQNITNLLDSINVSGSKPISKAILKLEESFAYAKRRYERQIKISQDLEGFLDSRGDAFYPENTRSENLALLKEITEQNLLVTRSELERSAKALEVLKDFESRGLEFIQTQADTISPEGTILRVRPLVSEHEMLDWFATLDSQPSGVKKVIGKLLNRLDQKTPGQEFLSSFLDDELERLNKDFDELTGQDLIGTYGNPGILVKAISEALLPEANDQVEPYQAASELLDSLGVKGIRFFDESSRETGRYLQKARIEGTDIVFPGYAGIESYPTKEAAEKALARAKGKMTYNLVIFNDKNLARVSEYRAGEPSRPKFSKRAANQQRTTLMEGFDNFVNMPFTNLPPASEKIVNGAFNALSTVKPSLRSAALGFLSLDQLAELYGKIMPSIKKLINVLERRATDVATRREFLERNIKKYHDVFKKYKPEQKAKFFQTFFDTTVEQIDPLIVTVKETIDSNGQVRRTRTYSLTKNPTTAGHPISQAFYSMPKEVQEVYVDMRREYDKYADELENLITKDVTPGTAKKLRTQFELKRLKVYLPLFRQGNYWLSYTDVSGEPVVMAFTTERERQLEKQHANSQKAKDIKEFARFEDIVSRTGQPPVGFVAGVIDTLQKEKVPKAVLDQVYSSYLSLFPAESVRQMYRKRKGIAGYETDAVEVFGNVGSRMVNQIGNLTHAKEIDAAMNGIIMEGEKDGSMVARDVAQNIAAQTQYMMNPIPNKWSARASSFSYYMYIAGNVSSAIINLTQLPIVVYGLLAGEYSAADAAAAMKSATSMYLNGAKDNNSTFLPDWTFGAGKNLRPDLKRLYDAAVQQAVIRRSTSHEIVDMRKATAGDYAGLRAKVETGLAWVFQNSERANREITLIAAYELARKKGLSEAAAIAKAMDTVKAAHGSALSETAPRYFQGDVGRVIFTFKRFAQSQIYLLGKLFNQAFRDADPKVRDVARKQLLGIYGMSFIFAGAHGVPLYGAGVMLAGFLMGDDDDPVDIEGYLNEALGDLIYKGPVNQLLNIDIAGRTGFNGMVWRDNPKRLAEVGPVTYMLEQLAGPSYSAALSVQKGLGMIADGEAYRGFEAMTPGAIKNVMKGMRFAIDGATNRDGVPIVQDVNAYNVVMQMVGFTPADLAEAYARAGAKKEVEKKILERRTSLLDKLYAARQDGDLDGVQEVRESIRAFNQKNPEKNVRIEQSTMERSYRGHKQREKEMEDGVHLNRALKHRLNEDYGTDED